MLGAFLKLHDIGVALLQEVTHSAFTVIQDNIGVNEGIEKRGTAILTKVGLPPQHIKRIPSGRGIVAAIKGIWIIHIYAPSGAEKRI